MTDGVNAGNVTGGIIITGSVGGNVSNTSINDIKSEERQNLAAAAEIKLLLDQLAQTYSEEAVIVNTIQTKIRHDPTLKARLINAFKSGGIEALKLIFAHPLVTVPVETIKGFLEAEA